MQQQELENLIFHGKEERNLEYIGPCNWSDPNIKAKITKTILSMSNIPDGGAIVIGVGDTGDVLGLRSRDRDSFKQDDISSLVSEYADPYSEITVSSVTSNSKDFVIVQVREFEELPVVCKKDGPRGLTRGTVYTRPRRKHESVAVPGQVEMREILERAVEKGIRRLYGRMDRAGLRPVSTEEMSEQEFEKQLNGL